MCGVGSWVLGIDVILTGVGGFVSSQNILVCLSTSTLDRDGKILMSQDDARTCLLLLIDKARSYIFTYQIALDRITKKLVGTDQD